MCRYAVGLGTTRTRTYEETTQEDQSMRAHQIMTRDVITVSPDTTITAAAAKMLDNHVSGLPVVDAAGNLVGVVSDGDFIRRSEIGTQKKRAGWLQFLVGPGKEASEFVRASGR